MMTVGVTSLTEVAVNNKSYSLFYVIEEEIQQHLTLDAITNQVETSLSKMYWKVRM